MAIRYAVTNGDWSNTATWDGGTLPAAGDDVRSNGFTVTVDGNYTCLTLSNKSESSPVVVAGGSFTLNAGVMLTATDGVIGGNATTTNAVNASYSSPGVSTIVGNCTGTAGRAVVMTGSGTLNIVGNIQNGGITSWVGASSSSGILNITGNIIGTGQVALSLTGSAACNITGNCSLNGASSIDAITHNSTKTLSIVGNITGQEGLGAANTVYSAGTVEIRGTVTAGIHPAVEGAPNSTNMFYFSGPLIAGSNGASPIMCARWAWIESPSGTYMEVRTSNLLSTRNLYTADYTSALHMPDTGDVRSGVVYGPSDELTGTCAVPPAGSVALGVPVDATTGTAALTQQAIADAVGPLIAAYGA